ncbi:MAG: transcriptional regulator [Actinomycetota bacterium]|nr:transcriptional regulator [Actinomycetota bacterium]
MSMYERRRKVPMLDVTERLLWAAGSDLGMVTQVVWEIDYLSGLKEFWYPSRLWRVEVPGCFDTVGMPDLIGQTGQDEWDLRKRDDRRHLYELLLIEGTQHMIQRWVDGALLVDIWDELKLPKKIRAAWEPAVRAAAAGGSHSSLGPLGV